jgi:hypothetical protein
MIKMQLKRIFRGKNKFRKNIFMKVKNKRHGACDLFTKNQDRSK